MLSQVEVMIFRATPEMVHHWGWFLVLGILLLLLGVAAIARSVAATVASMVFFGWLLVFAGLIELVQAFMVGKWAGFFLHLLFAILFAAIGILMLSRPVISAETLTYVMAIFFFVVGIYQLVAAIWTHQPGWGWQALNGVVAAILGALVLAQWPVSGLYAIGLFIGIDLVFFGSAWIALALDLRSMAATSTMLQTLSLLRT